jgi:hypothetical protein
VVINEPVEIFPALQALSIPWGIGVLHRTLRQRIRDGLPVQNKLRNGEFIEDTATGDVRESYVPRPSSADFCLGTKNTLAYLARLPQLKRVMPNALILACIRHPFDTVASWKTTFPHLASADMDAQPVGSRFDYVLSGIQTRRLEEIAATEDLALRRALLWRHLAESLLDCRPFLTLVRYEDVVKDPVRVLAEATEPLGLAWPRKSPSQGIVRRARREALDAHDIACINGTCTQVAAELGYVLYAPDME